MQSKARELIERLRELASGVDGPRRRQQGICWEIRVIVGRPTSYLDLFKYAVLRYRCRRIIKKHPNHSGNETYPIQHDWMGPDEAFWQLDLWDIETEYGRTRREWCGYIADKLEQKYG